MAAKRTVRVSTGREFDVREMTFGEVRRIRAEGDSLPYTWPAEQQLPPEALDDLPNSDVHALAEAVYELTYGTRKQLGN
jgi:hypothetical protein